MIEQYDPHVPAMKEHTHVPRSMVVLLVEREIRKKC